MVLDTFTVYCEDKALIFDKRGLELFFKYTWYLGDRYLYRGTEDSPRSFHREYAGILGLLTETTVDHINRNTLDNRAVNLRAATSSTQTQNTLRNKKTNSTSIYRGVNFQEGSWLARISKDYKRMTIGFYESELEAALAYDKRARELYGSHAFVNFPS